MSVGNLERICEYSFVAEIAGEAFVVIQLSINFDLVLSHLSFTDCAITWYHGLKSA